MTMTMINATMTAQSVFDHLPRQLAVKMLIYTFAPRLHMDNIHTRTHTNTHTHVQRQTAAANNFTNMFEIFIAV